MLVPREIVCHHRMTFYDPSTAAYLNPQTQRRVAVVTGGNNGIGWFTALHLYLHGYIVYIAGRNEQKVASAIESLQREAEAREQMYLEKEKSSRYFGELKSVSLDCCDLQSVKDCAAQLAKEESKIHILINNAGVMAVPYEITKDGFEIQYQVNYLAAVVLTEELLPLLTRAAEDTTPRVITLSSLGHHAAFKYFDPASDFHYSPDSFFTWFRYGHAKAGVVEYMSKFAQDHKDMLAFSIHPGIIPSTNLFEATRNMPFLRSVMGAGLNAIEKYFGVTPEEGALASLRAAMDPELGSHQSGSFLTTGGVETKPSHVASNKQNIEKTWARTVELLQAKGYLEAY